MRILRKEEGVRNQNSEFRSQKSEARRKEKDISRKEREVRIEWKIQINQTGLNCVTLSLCHFVTNLLLSLRLCAFAPLREISF
jgi:hypothetical protein